jgi:hypothetical protein
MQEFLRNLPNISSILATTLGATLTLINAEKLNLIFGIFIVLAIVSQAIGAFYVLCSREINAPQYTPFVAIANPQYEQIRLD